MTVSPTASPGPEPAAPAGTCSQRPGGWIGSNVGHQLRNVLSWSSCCNACCADAACAKWVWVPAQKQCRLHGAAATWGLGPNSTDPHLCGQVRNATANLVATSAQLQQLQQQSGTDWLSDAALEEERWLRDILGWNREIDDASLVWTDASTLGVEGMGGFPATSQRFWQRLPDLAKGAVPPGVFALGLQTSGVLVRFSSNSSTIGIAIQRSADTQPNTDDVSGCRLSSPDIAFPSRSFAVLPRFLRF